MTNTRYKLVAQDYKTRKGESNETTWAIGRTVTASGAGTELCTEGVLHAYATPLLAVLLNPIHANIPDPRMLVCDCSDVVAEDWGKSGHKWVTPVAEMELPAVTTTQRVAFGILCALEVYHEREFVAWAEGWLSGHNRSFDAAYAAAYAARAAATYAARAAVARGGADDADAADVAAAATYAADGVAAYAAAYAARGGAGKAIDFAKLAEQAMEVTS